ncbi:MAG: winged helix-turn-helix domain-containing protein [Promethearchaeota archaeon]
MATVELFANMSPASLKIYQILQSANKMTFKEISSQTRYSTRTVRYAIQNLHDAGLIGKVPDITDLRRIYYTINR